jgi:hypothetical protein
MSQVGGGLESSRSIRAILIPLRGCDTYPTIWRADVPFERSVTTAEVRPQTVRQSQRERQHEFRECHFTAVSDEHCLGSLLERSVASRVEGGFCSSRFRRARSSRARSRVCHARAPRVFDAARLPCTRSSRACPAPFQHGFRAVWGPAR